MLRRPAEPDVQPAGRHAVRRDLHRGKRVGARRFLTQHLAHLDRHFGQIDRHRWRVPPSSGSVGNEPIPDP